MNRQMTQIVTSPDYRHGGTKTAIPREKGLCRLDYDYSTPYLDKVHAAYFVFRRISLMQILKVSNRKVLFSTQHGNDESKRQLQKV